MASPTTQHPAHVRSVRRPLGSVFTRREFLATAAGGVGLASAIEASAGTAPPRSVASDPSALHYASLAAVAKLIETRQVSPVEVTQCLLERIAAVDGRLHCYATVTADRALAGARAAEGEILAGRYRGPLHGIPIALKDLCYTRGVATQGGMKILAGFLPDFDATLVSKLEAAGAVVLGKLNLHEGAYWQYHPDFCHMIPVNPWDSTRCTGGSSSGSGVATAAGLCFASTASDTGGSIRYPAAANGCVGLKPTYGRVSRYGVIAVSDTLDHLGPMTRTVEDAAIVYEAMAGSDPQDPTTLLDPVEPVRAKLGRGIVGFRVGFDRRYATERVEPAVVRAVEEVLEVLRRAGAEIVDVTMPDIRQVSSTWSTLCAADAALAHTRTFPSRAADYGPSFRKVLENGHRITGVTYARACKTRAEFNGRLNRMLADIDCLVCPGMSNAAREKSADPTVGTTQEWNRLVMRDAFAKPFDLNGSPTLSVPCGFTADGLPLSVQFVGRLLRESVICRIGHAYERATEWHQRHPAV